jgi:hypothetical protein
MEKIIEVRTDGLRAMAFYLECENAIWFDRLIFFPLLRWILMRWLKWNVKGGRIVFTY